MKVSIASEAAAELETAATFYAARGGKQLGLALIMEFERAINLIAEDPELGATWRNPAWRRHPVRRFPLSLVYRIRQEEIQVIALAHQKRRPGYWTERT